MDEQRLSDRKLQFDTTEESLINEVMAGTVLDSISGPGLLNSSL